MPLPNCSSMMCDLDILDAKIPRDLVLVAKHVFAPIGLTGLKVEAEPESREYSAVMLELGHLSARFRVAKVTPRKVGQFVTIWKRIGDGQIQPFDEADSVDMVVIHCRADKMSGQFVFPKAALCQRNVFSKNGEGGKRAIRVYPPWDKPTSQQALRSQAWQREYFLEMPEDGSVDLTRARALYGLG